MHNNPDPNTKPLKIIFLSDLNWDAHLRGITLKEVTDFTPERLSINRYQRIQRYWNIIKDEHADLVLFVGDLTGDGSCGHGYQNAFKILLKLLEGAKITSRFIAGNHDEVAYYQEVIDYVNDFKYTADISNQAQDVLGLSIAGIDFEGTTSKSRLNTICKQLNGDYDILIAHSELKRRIRLMELNAKFICTGHYDRKMFMHRDQIFISLDNDWQEVSYATIDWTSNAKVCYKVKQDMETTFSLEENWGSLKKGERSTVLLVNGNPAIDLNAIEGYPDNALMDDSGESLLYLKYLRGTNYAKALETLMKVKNKEDFEEGDLPLSDIFGFPIAPNYRISRRLIFDYLPKKK